MQVLSLSLGLRIIYKVHTVLSLVMIISTFHDLQLILFIIPELGFMNSSYRLRRNLKFYIWRMWIVSDLMCTVFITMMQPPFLSFITIFFTHLQCKKKLTVWMRSWNVNLSLVISRVVTSQILIILHQRVYPNQNVSIGWMIHFTVTINIWAYHHDGFGGLEVACWPLVPKFAGSNPAEAVGFLRAKKSSARLPSEGK